MSEVKLNKKCPTFKANIVRKVNDEFVEETIKFPSDYKGSTIVLYFYPRDNTPGCTTESQNFRDALDRFESQEAVVVGISRDSINSHKKFIDKQELNFPLIADPEEEICNMFGVMKQKMMYGKQVHGIERSTFIFDENGKLIKEWRGVKVPEHVEEVLSFIESQN
ncbi:peroxiredoxin [Taylorella asinigenitalis]|uniref:thioredoxin-dependent peroxiredoxin n=1 Tax=Taylorella asinigenitalis (strain MCE3) TaxID=1008459 RepID=G4QBB2_TAYAM|nr:peroxiredoxin [Taylorella asinigenitalis]AEP36733.1 Thiol peroxidase, Bcp-type [Taylorella asinigenitalis MCE3]